MVYINSTDFGRVETDERWERSFEEGPARHRREARLGHGQLLGEERWRKRHRGSSYGCGSWWGGGQGVVIQRAASKRWEGRGGGGGGDKDGSLDVRFFVFFVLYFVFLGGEDRIKSLARASLCSVLSVHY